MKWLKRIVCFLLYVVIIGCFAFLAYLFFFSKDERIRQILNTYFRSEKTTTEKVEVVEEIKNPPTQIPMPSFAEYDFFEITIPNDFVELESLRKFYYLHNIEIALIDNGYGIEIGAYFDLLQSSENSDTIEKQQWHRNFSYPIVTPPELLSDALVFITSDRVFHVLDLVTGAILKEEKLPIFPNGQGKLEKDGYYFKGRNEILYKIALKQRQTDDLFYEKGKDFSAFTHSQKISFTLSKKLEEEIAQRVLYWQPHLETVDFSSIKKLSPQNTELSLMSIQEPQLVAFTVPQQGEYTVGLADRENGWLVEKAYIAIFDNSANLLGVSIDYVADKPQVTVHLTENTVFYGVMGTLLEDVTIQECLFKVEGDVK